MRIRAFLVLLTVVNAAAQAQTAPNIVTHGLGVKSCGAYLEARKTKVHADLFAVYTAGYLTAVNFLTMDKPTGGNILRGTDMDGALFWLESYCRTHPTESFATALESLLVYQSQR